MISLSRMSVQFCERVQCNTSFRQISVTDRLLVPARACISNVLACVCVTTSVQWNRDNSAVFMVGNGVLLAGCATEGASVRVEKGVASPSVRVSHGNCGNRSLSPVASTGVRGGRAKIKTLWHPARMLPEDTESVSVTKCVFPS